MKRLVIVFALPLLLAATAIAKNRKDIPQAPLPQPVITAKHAFLVNGGGSALAYDAFYAAIQKWTHFVLVASPQDADIVIQVSYVVANHGTHVWSATNSYTGQTQVFSNNLLDPQTTLSIFDPQTKQLLWSAVDHPRLARRQSNQEKETINSVERLFQQLRTAIERQP